MEALRGLPDRVMALCAHCFAHTPQPRHCSGSVSYTHLDVYKRQLFSHTDESMFIGLPHTGGGYVSFLQLDNNVGDIALYLYQFGTGRSRIAATFPAASGSAYHGMTDEAVYWCDFSSGKAKIKCFSLETEETVSFPTAFARIENIALDSGMVYALSLIHI